MDTFPHFVSGFFTSGTPITTMGWTLFAIIYLWSVVWKGIALWMAARNGQRNWFVALLVINTVGILEIVYIYVFARKKSEATVAGASQIISK